MAIQEKDHVQESKQLHPRFDEKYNDVEDTDANLTKSPDQTVSESKDQADLRRIRQKQAEASRRYRMKKRDNPSTVTSELTLATDRSTFLMKEVSDVKQKLAESEVRQSELQTLNEAHALRL